MSHSAGPLEAPHVPYGRAVTGRWEDAADAGTTILEMVILSGNADGRQDNLTDSALSKR